MQAKDRDCYRYDRYFFWLGVACMAVFLLLGAGSFVVAYWNLDGSFIRPERSAVLFGLFWSAWTLLGVWLILSAVRGRLFVTDEGIQQVGCFRQKTVRWRDVSMVRWRLLPAGGCVVLRGAGQKVTIEFGAFARPDRPELIERIHAQIPGSIQENWDAFGCRWLRAPDPSAQWKIWCWLPISLVLFLIAGMFVWLWLGGLGVQSLVMVAVNAAAALWAVRKPFGGRSRKSPS